MGEPHQHGPDRHAQAEGAEDGDRAGHTHGPGGHSHAVLDRDILTHRRAIRAIWFSVAGLGLTAAFQLAIVAASGSAGLFADALHNVGDVAGTGLLLIGFRLARRPASDRFTYGWHRAEDLAGLGIVIAIAVSAALAGWDSLDALFSAGHQIDNIGWAFAAALVGAAGNELVAVFKIRVGRSIDSVALMADGRHARVDGLVSLGAAAGIAGAWVGIPNADPLAGLVITVSILVILVRTAREVLARNLDAVDHDLVGRLGSVAARVEGVSGTHAIRARHVGRSLLVQLHIEVDGSLPLRQAHAIGEAVRHDIAHELPNVRDVDVHVDPAGERHDAHADTAHHFGTGGHGH